MEQPRPVDVGENNDRDQGEDLHNDRTNVREVTDEDILNSADHLYGESIQQGVVDDSSDKESGENGSQANIRQSRRDEERIRGDGADHGERQDREKDD